MHQCRCCRAVKHYLNFYEYKAKIIITFTAYDRGYKIKDEEAFSAIVAHLNRLEARRPGARLHLKKRLRPVGGASHRGLRQPIPREVQVQRRGGLPLGGCPLPRGAFKYHTLDEKASELPNKGIEQGAGQPFQRRLGAPRGASPILKGGNARIAQPAQ